MALKKQVSVNYYIIRQGDREGNIGDDFFETMEKVETKGKHGFFDSGNKSVMFSPCDPLTTIKRKFNLFAFASEKAVWPAVIDRENGLDNIHVDSDEVLAGVTYALFDNVTKSICTLSQGGPGGSDIQNFGRMITGSSNFDVFAIGRKDVIKEVMNWEEYLKVKIAFNVPSKDASFQILEETTYGANYELLRHLEGVSHEQIISAGGEKRLNSSRVRSFIKRILDEGYMRKLVVTGKTNSDANPEEYDLCSPKLKYKTEITMSGRCITPDEAKTALFEAYQINQEQIEAATDKYAVDDEDAA